MFSPDRPETVARGEISVSVRLWSRPKARAGGQCPTAGVVIEVDSIEFMPFSAVSEQDVRRSGGPERESLRARAAHWGTHQVERQVRAERALRTTTEQVEAVSGRGSGPGGG